MRPRNRCWHWLLLGACMAIPVLAPAQESAAPGMAAPVLERLVSDATGLISARYTRPLGRVVDRQRGRVFVAIDGEPPGLGAYLSVTRPFADTTRADERPIAELQVSQVSPGMVECRETSRSGREHAEKDDIVRAHGEPVRILLAPCTTLMDLPPAVPEIVGEKMRGALRARPELQLAGDGERERAAIAAYTSRTMTAFLQEQEDLDEVLFPVLLRTPDKLVLNVEYYSVSRRRAVDIAVAAVELDDMLRSWFGSGAPTATAPPGFRLLAAQEFPWRAVALVGIGPGMLLSVTGDSLRVLQFARPGLRPTDVVSLGPRDMPRRTAYALVLTSDVLRASGAPIPTGPSFWVLSESRWPRAISPDSDGRLLQPGPAGTGLELRPTLEALWRMAGGPPEFATRWWPAPGRGERPVFAPVFADIDGDAALDVAWSDRRGHLLVRQSAGAAHDAFRGFGDVKAVQPAAGAESRPVFWLTDPVCCGPGDRLHAAQMQERSLRVVWSSAPFVGMLTAVASLDLDGDGAFDLVAAEQTADGTRLHVYLAQAGERTTARGAAMSPNSPR